jgi:hypothetical protein
MSPGAKSVWKEIGLHLPARDFLDLAQTKYPRYVMKRKSSEEAPPAEMDKLFSGSRIFDYAAILVSMHSFAGLQAQDLESPQTLLASLTPDSDGQNRARESSLSWLRASQELISWSIIQESLLAGEPLLPLLSSRFSEILNDGKSSTQQFNFIRGNPLLSQNLVNYYIWSIGGNQISPAYAQAIAQKDPVMMARVLGLPREFIERRTGHGPNQCRGQALHGQESQCLVIKLGLLREPGPGQKREDMPEALVELQDLQLERAPRIIYSQNLYDLVFVQEQIVEELVKLQPFLFRDQKAKNLTSIILK